MLNTCLQIFLTANPKLRSEVAKQFHKLRAAILRDSDESKRLEDLSKQDYTSLADIPSDAFPLFWTTKQYLRAVDATLPPTTLSDGPFFPRWALHLFVAGTFVPLPRWQCICVWAENMFLAQLRLECAAQLVRLSTFHDGWVLPAVCIMS